MGTNQSWLAVKPSDVELLEKSIVESYESRGAKLLHRNHDPTLERMTTLGRGAKLGVAIVKEKRARWACIVDSQVGTSDGHLARYLAKKLRTTVFRYTDIDTVSFYGVERFGPSIPATTATAGCSRYPDLEETDGARFLCFAKVAAKAYDEGSTGEILIRCAGCGYRGAWCTGYDVPSVPTAEDLLSIHGKQSARGTRVLVVVRCPNCQERDVGLGAMRLDNGLLVDCKLIATKPKTLDRFDFILAFQREAIERIVALPRTVAAPKKKAGRGPRPALERALAALRLDPRPGKPPPLSLVFAATRERIRDAIDTAARGFVFEAEEEGGLQFRLLAWLGPPKAGSDDVASFISEIADLVGDGSFGRIGRNPETDEWMLVVAFPLPDATWGALLLFDTYA